MSDELEPPSSLRAEEHQPEAEGSPPDPAWHAAVADQSPVDIGWVDWSTSDDAETPLTQDEPPAEGVVSLEAEAVVDATDMQVVEDNEPAADAEQAEAGIEPERAEVIAAEPEPAEAPTTEPERVDGERAVSAAEQGEVSATEPEQVEDAAAAVPEQAEVPEAESTVAEARATASEASAEQPEQVPGTSGAEQETGAGLANGQVAGEPAAVPAPAGEAEPPPRYRITPSWPPPRRRRFGVRALCVLVLIVIVALLATNGQFGGRTSDRTNEAKPVLKTDPASVPEDWIVYRHSTSEFAISHPPAWAVREEGRTLRISDPASGAELRIDHRRSGGDDDPEQVWLEQERTVASTNGYRRLQLREATYLGHDAALWEYVRAEGQGPLRIADLGFATNRGRFVLSFQTKGSDWGRLLPVFQGFLSSFRPPA